MNHIPLSLYIHIPWCIKKCPYCDFNSFTLNDKEQSSNYFHALQLDLQQSLPFINNRQIQTIYIGGGTPTILPPESIADFLSKISGLANIAKDAEISIEANPGTVTKNALKTLRNAGINRISIGVQSWQDEKLQLLGRIHNSHDALLAITAAYDAGFDNLNIDLMHGLPEQTLDDAIFDLNKTIKFQPTHISWYQLTIEKNSFFYSHPPENLPSEELKNDIHAVGENMLEINNYQHYEISGYCTTNNECKHNLNYWTFGDYLGIGAGAHSKITNLESRVITRFSKFNAPEKYLDFQNNFIDTQNSLAEYDLVLEFMLNALRLYQPMPFKLFTDRTFIDQNKILETLKVCEANGFLKTCPNYFETTAKGKNFLNDLLLYFV